MPQGTFPTQRQESASLAEIERAIAWIAEIKTFLRGCMRGKNDIIDLSIATLLAGGHLLLEGSPGTGKTLLARSLAAVFNGSFRRVQMTSDLLPSDIVGILRLRPGHQEFEFREGPIFANVLLADELNRTSPKTQSALLEAMAEGTVTVDGVPRPLPDPFFTIATQNPHEFQGVYPLAESQLDRFMLHLPLDTPEKKDELDIYRSQLVGGSAYQIHPDKPLAIADIQAIKKQASVVHVEDSILEYCADIVRATRHLIEVSYGVSVRGGFQFLAASRALALVRGRTFLTPEEVRDVAIPALAHRLCVSGSQLDIEWKRKAVKGVLEKIKAPR